jgi:hypothetical protein
VTPLVGFRLQVSGIRGAVGGLESDIATMVGIRESYVPAASSLYSPSKPEARNLIPEAFE